MVIESFKEHLQPGLSQPQLEARLVSAGKEGCSGGREHSPASFVVGLKSSEYSLFPVFPCPAMLEVI